jgi:diguanylate cyclase (GGDEF)-like protein
LESCLKSAHGIEFRMFEAAAKNDKLRNASIGKRIAKLVAAVTFLAVMLAASAQIVAQTLNDLEYRKLALEATAYAMAASAATGIATGDEPSVRSALTAMTHIPDILLAIAQDENGETVASMGQAAYLANDVLTATDSSLAMLFKGRMPAAVDIIKGGEVRGKLTVLGDISNIRRHVVLSAIFTLVAAIAAASLGVLASIPLQRRLINPLSTLTETIQRIRNSRNFSANLEDLNSQDEVGALVKSFNGMMEGIRFRDSALQKLAYFDPLTGLANRASFQLSLQEWLAVPVQVGSGAVALMNIHGFRTLNDAFGHSTGDAILMTVAAAMKSAIHEDAMLARNGGDEFAIWFTGVDSLADVEMSIARIQSAFFRPLKIGELEIHISLSAGACFVDAQQKSKFTDDIIMRQADLALAEAKSRMAGRVEFFRPELVAKVEEDTALGQALRVAAKSGAFQLHYQCQFDVARSNIAGFEALVRWTHPTRGPISPGVFIPVAERIGLVSVIGDWVMMEACRQAANWHRQGLPPRVMSVNISPAQILSAGFVEKVRGALRKTGLPPHLLCLELTESIFIGSSYAETVMIIETLSKDGVTFALDDFGTGYSSLSYISKLPFHTVKVDRAFVANADKDHRKRGMLASIVQMIHGLGMTVVAEGAETAGEVALLQELKVGKIQGFVIAKPMPAPAALARSQEIEDRYALLAG